MVCNAYDNYKKEILYALNNGIWFKDGYQSLPLIKDEYNFPKIKELTYAENILSYGDMYYRNRLCDMEHPRYRIGNVYLLEDQNGKVYGKELFNYLFSQNLICGSIDRMSYEDISRLGYDKYGDMYQVTSGMIAYSQYSMLKEGMKVRYRNYGGTFFIDDVDEDGIIVLPPHCTGVCLLNPLLISKVKKIISISPEYIYPHLYAINRNYKLDELNLSTYIPLDCSNVSFEVYACQHKEINYYASYDINSYMINNVYAFNFKEIIMNLYYDGYENITNSLKSKYSNVVYNIYSEKIKSLELSDSETKSLTINNLSSNKDFLLIYEDYYAYNRLEDLSITNVYKFFLQSSKGVILVLNNWINNIPDNAEVYINSCGNYSFNMNSKDSVFDLFFDVLDEAKNRNIKLSVIDAGSKECKFDKFDSYDSYDIDYLIESSLMTDLGSAYTKKYINKEYMDSYKHKDYIYNFMEKLFGKCESTYGLLGYREACEKFCQPDINMFFKSIDIKSGSLEAECGAGVTVTLNFMQLYLLRMSGLESYQYIKLNESNIYSGLYSTEFKNSLHPIKGDECILFNDKLKNCYSSVDKYDLCVLTFFQGHYSNSYYSASKSIYYNKIKNKRFAETQYCLDVSLLQSESGPYKYDYKTVLCGSSRINVRDDLAIGYRIHDTSWKNLNEALRLSKQSLLSYSQTLSLLSYVNNSKSKNLYGGRQVECLKASRCTNSQLPKDLIMDIVKSDYDYTVFNIKCLDTNEVFNVEGKTLYQLLSKGDLVSDNLNYTLIKNEVLWLRNDYDKEVTANIEHMLGTKTLFSYSENGEDDSLADYGMHFYHDSIANSYGMNFYNIGTELMLPSYITYASEDINQDDKNKIIAKYGENAWSEIESVGIEVGNEEEVDVTFKINSLLKDPSTLTNVSTLENPSVARKNHVKFYCGEKAVYKGNKPLVIKSIIANELLELPRKMSIDFCYFYAYYGIRDIYNHDVKVVVRDSSTIYSITCATEVDIAENCLIHASAFSCSRIKKCVIHGGNIPRECFSGSINFEELVIDGGHVLIDISAFKGCHNFKGITVINGGSYHLLNADNAVEIDYINNDSDLKIPFYKDLVESYQQSLSVEDSECKDVIPIGINSDRTIQLRYSDGSESSITVERLYTLYKKNLLNFKICIKDGPVFNFIEQLKYSKIDCLVFYPKFNNDFCNDKVLLILDMEKVKEVKTLSKASLIFAYQKSDWLNGRIVDVPFKYLSPAYDSAVFFDDENYNNLESKTQDAIVYHFWQNLSYYQYYFWDDWNDYYLGGRKNAYLKPEEVYSFYKTYNDNHISNFDTLYFPASHEFSWYYKKMDASGDKKGEVVIGGLSRYGRMMHNKRYLLPKAAKVSLIPGIGENCLMRISKVKVSAIHSFYNLLWQMCSVLEIKTPTVIESNALIYCVSYEDSLLHYYENSLDLLDIYSDTKISLFSVLFNKCVVHNASLVIDCDTKFSKKIEYYLNKNSFIEFDGDCKFQVNGLTAEQLRFLITNQCNNYAYQLLINSDTFDKLMEFNDIKQFYLDCKSGIIKVKRAIKKPIRFNEEITIKAEPYQINKNVDNDYSEYLELFSDDIEVDEKPASMEEIEEESLSTGIIPDMITLDYMGDKVSELDPDVYKQMLGEESDEIDFSNLKSSADVLIEMCNIDVNKLEEQGDKEREENSFSLEEENLVKEFIIEKEVEESKNQIEVIKNNIKSQNELSDKVRFSVVSVDEYRKMRNKRIEARRLYDEKKDSVDKIVEIKNENDIFNDDFVPTPKNNTHHVIDSYKKKPSGLASSLLSDIINSYKKETTIIELEILNSIYQENILVGYEVLNKSSGVVKRLSIKNIIKLCKNGKYRVINAEDYDFQCN